MFDEIKENEVNVNGSFGFNKSIHFQICYVFYLTVSRYADFIS
jgi:hypothetical protein